MVHPKNVFEQAASPHPDIRIVNNLGLDKLRSAVKAYSISLATTGGYTDSQIVQAQLSHFKLSATEIVDLCTVAQGAK